MPVPGKHPIGQVFIGAGEEVRRIVPGRRDAQAVAHFLPEAAVAVNEAVVVARQIKQPGLGIQAAFAFQVGHPLSELS